MTAKEKARSIIEYAKGQGLSGVQLYDRMEACGKYLDESSKGNEIPANRRPRPSTRAKLMRLGVLLMRWARIQAGYSDDRERTAQYEAKLKEVDNNLPRADR